MDIVTLRAAGLTLVLAAMSGGCTTMAVTANESSFPNVPVDVQCGSYRTDGDRLARDVQTMYRSGWRRAMASQRGTNLIGIHNLMTLGFERPQVGWRKAATTTKPAPAAQPAGH